MEEAGLSTELDTEQKRWTSERVSYKPRRGEGDGRKENLGRAEAPKPEGDIPKGHTQARRGPPPG